MTAEPTDHEPTIGQRVTYTRNHLPPERREPFEMALREATRLALDTGDYQPLDDVIEQWWRAAFVEDHGGENWQRQKRLIEEGRWDELFPQPARDPDQVITELLS